MSVLTSAKSLPSGGPAGARNRGMKGPASAAAVTHSGGTVNRIIPPGIAVGHHFRTWVGVA